MWYLVDDSFDFVPEDVLYGKLAAGSSLSGQDLRSKLEELQGRATRAEDRVVDLRQALFAKRHARVAQKARRKG